MYGSYGSYSLIIDVVRTCMVVFFGRAPKKNLNSPLFNRLKLKCYWFQLPLFPHPFTFKNSASPSTSQEFKS